MVERWIPSSHGFQVVTEDSMHAIALVKDTGDPDSQFKRAALLAAAPELLTACEAAAASLAADEEVMIDWDADSFDGQLLAQLRMAIRKAKG
jgi:hypothetical protein